uniref:non-specific serine/threonine protein kinase n=1 Tax=Pogona vitticeps TaxID=103695 RepID=A0ABM5FKF1_9SAUR
MPLGEYAFVRAVGKGSYGEVSLVRHRRDNKQYVIKKLNLKHASRRERKAAEQEAQLLSQLKHPNIVTYRESWEGEDGMLYIVMGFCEGGDLYHKLKEQKGQLLPESQVVEWFVQIAMALQYLHEKHILHRDLKTQNVFLTRSNIIKVGDLGIARVLENQYDMASTLIGTPYYMSPELFSNKPYNYKSDVWALGCCAYELATLKHAFNARDMNSLVYRIIEGKLPPMPKDYSVPLKELIKTMLSKKPEDRPSVRSILRQPYIKHQISLFLEATKAKTSKSRNRLSEHNPQNEVKNGTTIPQKLCNEHPRKSKVNLDATEELLAPFVPVEIMDEASCANPDKSKDEIQNEHAPCFQPQGSIHEPSLSQQQRQKRREQFEALRRLPSPPDVNSKKEEESICKQKAVKKSRSTEVAVSKDRPLSARERRRLKQSQEDMLPLGPAARQKSQYAAAETKLPDHYIEMAQFSSEAKQKKSAFSTEDLSSSTSSTERSDGDCKEGKTNEMNDLVQLMTQTLKIGSKENCSHSAISAPESQFRLNRKYRDTLILHGKASEEAEEFPFQEFPSDVPSGPAKIRRLVEILRADVVQGLGVKLLEKVYEVLEEDDEDKRELYLRKLMGEKYISYSTKARHLKFLEDNVKL